MCYCILPPIIVLRLEGSLKILREFRTDSPVPGTRALAFIDGITIILLPKSARYAAAIAKITSWLQELLALERVQLNDSKSQALLAGGHHSKRYLGDPA